MFLETVLRDATSNLLVWLDPTSRVWGLYLISALALAYVGYGHLKRSGHLAKAGAEPPGFFSFVFNKEAWLHKSTRQDLLLFLGNAIVFYGVISQFLLGSYGLSVVFHNWLETGFGALGTPLIGGVWSLILYSFAMLLAVDLGVYLTHLAQHKIPLLWKFHQVHHSAERLTPLTLFRMHPVDLAVTALAVTILSAVAYAGIFYLSGEAPQALTVLGLNIFLFAFNLFGYNLRHSEIWLNYPAWLSRLLISPAQHQIHHSADPKHFDRNLGLVFSIWDQLFGTYHRAKSYQPLAFGLSRALPNPYPTLTSLYWRPFEEAAQLLLEVFETNRRRVILALLALAGSLFYAQILLTTQHAGQVANANPPSLRLVDLTWTEVEAAMDAGYDTAIIPTAGVEQNGPHLVLGKHNLVIDHTSQAIAHRLGNALVLPVIDYVPEGEVGDDPTGHMRFAGSVSVPEDIFDGILEAAARSARTHGFNAIFFVGDSLGNQEAQARVAARLQAEWRDEDVIVAHLGDYYSANGQFETLVSRGYSAGQIGGHAGIRDTSEVLFIDPQAVRARPVPAPSGRPSGVDGDPSLATARLGEQMLALKIEAALAQIEQIMTDRNDETFLVSTSH